MTAMPNRVRVEIGKMTKDEVADFINAVALKQRRPPGRNINGDLVRVRLRTETPDNAFITANEREIS